MHSLTEQDLFLLHLLADGHFHSGEELAEALGIGRAAIWKRINRLEHLGLDVQRISGRGYRWLHPLPLLDAATIAACGQAAGATWLHAVEVQAALSSTNDHLMNLARQPDTPSGRVCLAEMQTAGRGRRGRTWSSPPASHLYLSLLWRLSLRLADLSGLSLAVGVAIARSLESAGLHGHGLKWPNDLLHDGRKLGGILIEFVGESSGPVVVVIGIGLNVRLSTHLRQQQADWTDLHTVHPNGAPDRNRLAGSLLAELGRTLHLFETQGLAALADDWARFDLARGRPIRLLLPQGEQRGRCVGIDPDGALLLETSSGIQAWSIGEVSLRWD